MSDHKTVRIGTTEDKHAVRIDVASLVTTKLLVTANSGGGKSYLMRKLFEQIGRHAQLIVLDLEGEFVTLREELDLVIVGPTGEIPTDVRAAGLLVRRLMEKELSAVIDMSELKPGDRRAFVHRFCETMIELPKSLWHPCFIGLDETHLFCPEKGQGEAESTEAVIDLCSRGRKRGFCPILATQRISKLHKDAAAECNNKFIGRTTLDVDLKRAAFELGVTAPHAIEMLRDLEAGEFYCFGPALKHKGVLRLTVDKADTTHPHAGKGKAPTPPKPSSAIADAVKELTDLPKQAEAEIRDVTDARRKINELERQVRTLAKSQPAPQVKEVTSKKEQHTIARLRKGLEEAMKVIAEIHAKGFEAAGIDPSLVQKAVQGAADQIVRLAEQSVKARQVELDKLKRELGQIKYRLEKLLEGTDEPVSVRVDVKHNEPFTVTPPTARPQRAAATSAPSTNGMPIGEGKILTACIQFPDGVTREQLTVLTGYKRSSRDTYIQRLREKELIDTRGDMITATDQGIAALPNAEPLPTGEDLREYWRARLPQGELAIFDVLVAAYPNTVSRDELSEKTNYQRSSRDTYLQRMGAKRLVDSVGRGEVKASDQLF
jgi:hypothetical protein